MNVLKHVPPRSDWVRFTPPSKNCAIGSEWPTSGFSVLAAVSQGVVIATLFAAPQASSFGSINGLRQSTPLATASSPSSPVASSPFQR